MTDWNKEIEAFHQAIQARREYAAQLRRFVQDTIARREAGLDLEAGRQVALLNPHDPKLTTSLKQVLLPYADVIEKSAEDLVSQLKNADAYAAITSVLNWSTHLYQRYESILSPRLSGNAFLMSEFEVERVSKSKISQLFPVDVNQTTPLSAKDRAFEEFLQSSHNPWVK